MRELTSTPLTPLQKSEPRTNPPNLHYCTSPHHLAMTPCLAHHHLVSPSPPCPPSDFPGQHNHQTLLSTSSQPLSTLTSTGAMPSKQRAPPIFFSLQAHHLCPCAIKRTLDPQLTPTLSLSSQNPHSCPCALSRRRTQRRKEKETEGRERMAVEK